MSFSKYLICLVTIVALTSCGGGGGSAGSTGATGGGGGTTGSVVVQPAAAAMSIDVLSGAGVATNSISASEISTVTVILKDAAGVVVPGAVVTFAESGGSLLSVAPASKTALTDSAGKASVEIRAATTSSVGATTIGASAQVSAAAVTAQKSIAITSAPTSGTVTDPQLLANAMNFLDVNPADKSIVLAGAGGNGRSESATLRFRVVDRNNTPVKGAVVTFAVNPPGDVTLNIASATSDADGVVLTTVSSKSVATAVVITATITRTGGTITSQSDQLLITTGIATLAGFDLSATKFNLNSNLSGDLSVITVRIRDANGNRVADGVPVVFTADYGAVGSSARGGCVTLNGGCSVDYIVQDPRPLDGTLATVIASTQVGVGAPISRSANFIFSEPRMLNVYANVTGAVLPAYTFGASCGIKIFSAYGGTPAGFPAPAGTTVDVLSITPGFAATLKLGSPILDGTSRRTPLVFELDVSTISGADACVAAGARTVPAIFNVKFTAGTTVITRQVSVTYPAAP